MLAGIVASVDSSPIRFTAAFHFQSSDRLHHRASHVDVDNSKASNFTQMKTLLVLRHAKSSWNDSALDDHQRPLNRRGRQDGPRMGALMREYGLVPDVVISSDAVRARLTAEAVAEAARYTASGMRGR